MYQYVLSTVVILFYISVILISIPVLAQSLAPVENIADFFATFLTSPFARSIAIIGLLACCGFMTRAGKLPWRAALVVIGGIMPVFGAAALPEIPNPLLLRRRV